MKQFFYRSLFLFALGACTKTPPCDDSFVENKDKQFAPYQVNQKIVLQNSQGQFDTLTVKSYEFHSNQFPHVDCGGKTEGFKCVIQTNWFLPTDSSKKVDLVYESFIELTGYRFVRTDPTDFYAGDGPGMGNGILKRESAFSIGGQHFTNVLNATCQDTAGCKFFSKIVFSRNIGLVYVENKENKWWLKE